MSNLSNIGYPTKSEEELEKLTEKAYKNSNIINSTKGSYAYYLT